jgi:hypothetical protein
MSEQVAIEVIEGASVTVEVVEDGGVQVVEITAPSAVEVVEVIHPGPQGPSGTSFEYQQPTPSTTWVINHNLGYRPTVELLDAGSQEIDGAVSHPSINQTIVTLNPATAGTARLT